MLGCSIGAEVYSILWSIRSTRPDLKVFLGAVDISKEGPRFAENGIYAPDTSQLVGASIFERLTATEMAEIFDWEGDQAKIKPWLREGITWHLGDAADPELGKNSRTPGHGSREQFSLSHTCSNCGKVSD